MSECALNARGSDDSAARQVAHQAPGEAGATASAEQQHADITAAATRAALRHLTRALPNPGNLLVASRHISARLYAEHVPLPRIKLNEQPVYKIIT